MSELKDNLQTRLSEMVYGEIQAIPMVDRGPYRELDESENLDTTTGASRSNVSELLTIAKNLASSDEDFISVQRKNEDVALTLADFDWYLAKLEAKKHLIFVNCLNLGTSEIKAFILALFDSKKLGNSKIFLLDLPQVEYLTIRDSLAGKIKM
ncbi:hypothetical protein [Lactovum miscens]|uniref:Uncharacterized protein n=1 Tax=Lactovum miscens TaxID=190387 RepID=A0A841C9U6_9LACT|nr:hypothetical protein [Lactovum miscens]MBB5887960.1 hypothetical protein [Lactovum miscens]